MSEQYAIAIKSVSKTYKLYKTRYDIIKEFISPFRKKYQKKFDALKDISFDIERGEVIGIMGKNGSGKSTLLKILTSVVTPTSGNFECNGRVSSLLELGGGFNMELTGIENIYYLGAIQGYPKRVMKSKIKDILDFADIGEYVYQPVNTYSSGMYLRLAFSMAINIDPDILIIDEALAVGDIRFQQKCFRKIREFKDQGKTILICSHNLTAITDFCTRAIWLHNSEIKEQGDPVFVTDAYKMHMTSVDDKSIKKTQFDQSEKTNELDYPLEFPGLIWKNLTSCDSYGTGQARIQYASLAERETMKPLTELKGGEKVRVLIKVKSNETVLNLGILLTINGNFGSTILKINSLHYTQRLDLQPNTAQIIAIDFIFPHINNGRYTLSFGLSTFANKIMQQLHWVHDGLIIEVSNPKIQYKIGSQIVIRDAVINILT